MVVATRELLPVRSIRARYFYLGIALLLVGLVIWGFGPSYYLPLFAGTLELSPLLHLHGLVFSAWVLFFVAQASLIAGGRRRVHMTMGWIGTGLAAVIVALGVVVTVASLEAGVAGGRSGESQRFIVHPLGDLVLFSAFFLAAVLNRRRAETHKRLMILAMLAMMPPALFRISFPWFGMDPTLPALMTAVVVLLGIAHDRRTHGRVHPVYLYGGAIVVAILPLRVLFANTDAWLALTSPLVRLVS